MLITRRLTFCAAHRLVGHEGHCANIHGHNYVALVTVAPGDTNEDIVPNFVKMDKVGRVVDFSKIKAVFGGWLDANWDHSFLASPDDHAVIKFLRENGFPCYVMPRNPTAENMALHLLVDVFPELAKGIGVTVVSVRIEETENCAADVSLDDLRQPVPLTPEDLAALVK